MALHRPDRRPRRPLLEGRSARVLFANGLLAASLLASLAACRGDSQAEAAPQAMADAAAIAPAVPDPRGEVKAALAKFRDVRSWHATMRMEGSAQGVVLNEVDFVAPDRYRIRMPTVGSQTIIGDTMYLTMHGRTSKVPMPPGTLTQWRDPARMAGNEADMTVLAQGTDHVGTTPTRKYLVHHAKPHPVDVTLWLGEDDLPVQLQVSSSMQGSPVSTTVRYSHYNDPSIRIDTPQ
jgi:hypothetical protein